MEKKGMAAVVWPETGAAVPKGMCTLWNLSFLLMLAWLFSPIAVSGAPAQQREPWFFPGDGIPVPPRQNQPWQPPETDIPAEYVNAISAAFQRGVADPRGCEYREVTVPFGSDGFGGFGRLNTRGWLLPRNGEHSPQFAILWNGVVFPVISVGPPASVEVDGRKLVAFLIQQKAICENPPTAPDRKRLEFPQIFFPGSFHYGVICALLLRSGETALAEKVYHYAVERHVGIFPLSFQDNISRFALWSLFSRALAAHRYGDDKLALCYAEQYEPLLKDDQAEFVATARKLLAEQRRRTRKPPVPKNEIDALILGLENVDARQYAQPGGVILGEDQRVKALIAVGDPAVEPLLECLEQDRRLTRSVSFHRDFAPQRHIIPVAEAAYVALCGILQQSFSFVGANSGDPSGNGIEYRKELARQIRRHFERYRNMSFEDKWYHILQNDDEPVELQLQAAANICRKSNVKEIPHSGGGLTVTVTDPNAASVQLTGEALRSKSNPSVSELLNRRAVEYLPVDESAAASSRAFVNAQRMALYSAVWDLPKSLPALRQVSDAIYRELRKYESLESDRFEWLVPLTIQRARAGDLAALRQYCETLLANPESILGKNGQNAWGKFLQPLYSFPEDATVIATAEKIFNTTGTAWSEYFGKFGDARKIQQWLFAEFMRLAPYRKHVENGLKDKTAILKWQTIIIGDRVDFRLEFLDSGGSGSYGDQADRVKSDPRFPGDRSTQILRVCDVYARALSALKDGGYPEFQNYWDEKERDKAIEAIASKLSRNPDYKAPVLSEMEMLPLYGF